MDDYFLNFFFVSKAHTAPYLKKKKKIFRPLILRTEHVKKISGISLSSRLKSVWLVKELLKYVHM